MFANLGVITAAVFTVERCWGQTGLSQAEGTTPNGEIWPSVSV